MQWFPYIYIYIYICARALASSYHNLNISRAWAPWLLSSTFFFEYIFLTVVVDSCDLIHIKYLSLCNVVFNKLCYSWEICVQYIFSSSRKSSIRHTYGILFSVAINCIWHIIWTSTLPCRNVNESYRDKNNYMIFASNIEGVSPCLIPIRLELFQLVKTLCCNWYLINYTRKKKLISRL